MPETPNHNYNLPNPGDQNWHQPLNENFRQYDTDIEIRDQTRNMSDYEPKDGAKFLATDTGNVFVGDGDQWNLLNTATRSGPGLSQNIPVPPVHGYAEIKDSEGNQMGYATFDGRQDLVKVLRFDHDWLIPTDVSSGDLIGVRQHRPLTFVKPYDKATPLLADALANGETLQEVIFHWYRQESGSTVEFFNTTLENVKISEIHAFGSIPQEAISLLYGKITWLSFDGNIQYTDSWTAER